MERRMTLEEYLGGEETNRPQELAYGILREPDAPGIRHQLVVGRIYVRLVAHVLRHKAGRVVLSPVDVILDRERALVVQPDIVFVSTERMGICRDRIWGAPDLVVEVLSTTNRLHDRKVKVGWYRQYGVRESWIVDADACQIEVHESASKGPSVYGAQEIIRSTVLPRLRLRPADVCDD